LDYNNTVAISAAGWKIPVLPTSDPDWCIDGGIQREELTRRKVEKMR
jgi:hypothetical protein